MDEYKTAPDESIFLDLSPDEASLLFYVFGVAISQSLTIDELNLLGNGLFEMAQVMLVIAAQRTLLNDAMSAKQEESDDQTKEEKSSQEWMAEIKKLQDQIELLQKQIDELRI